MLTSHSDKKKGVPGVNFLVQLQTTPLSWRTPESDKTKSICFPILLQPLNEDVVLCNMIDLIDEHQEN